MFDVVFTTEELPAAGQFAHWRELGPVRLCTATVTPLHGRRTAPLIRRSDPQEFLLVLVVDGGGGIASAGRIRPLGPGDLVVADTSQPARLWLTADHNSLIAVGVPRALLPLSAAGAERLRAMRASGLHGAGAILAHLMLHLSGAPGGHRTHESARLAATIPDFLAVLASPAHDHTWQHELVPRIEEFIERHLADPLLSPRTIAEAHHISLRYLHRIFQGQEMTVAVRIRRRRLERCRRDLADPVLHARPIHAIAAGWGFPQPSEFTRAFRTAYGMPPSAYRRLTAQAPPRSPGRPTTSPGGPQEGQALRNAAQVSMPTIPSTASPLLQYFL